MGLPVKTKIVILEKRTVYGYVKKGSHSGLNKFGVTTSRTFSCQREFYTMVFFHIQQTAEGARDKAQDQAGRFSRYS